MKTTIKKWCLRASLILVSATALTSCLSSRLFTKMPSEVDVPLAMESVSFPLKFNDLSKGITLNVKSEVAPEDMYDDEAMPKKQKKLRPKYNFTPSVQQFAQSSTRNYMQQMGFDVTPSGDYRLIIDVRTFSLRWIGENNAEIRVVLTYTLKNEAAETVIPITTVNVKEKPGLHEDFGTAFGRVYGIALSRIDWERIADFLKVAKQAKDEKNAAVSGDGDTALEHTVIRWFVNSNPQGADVSWRVISSTPEVSNTNSNYVGSTPYETTESFDIKGMTYNNSGNVQIEITCERPGYLPQKKRFNVRQAIDQKEISAKFNLVKED